MGEAEEEDEEELVELPGGVDQLEALLEEEEQRAEDNSKLVFDKHNGSVFCCNMNSNVGLVVTGGEDDRALIWRLEDGKVDEEVAGWGDSVTCAAWSKDGGLLALADMSGSLRVLRCPGYEKVWTFEVGDLVWMKWHPVANVLFVGTEDSQLWMFKMPGGDSKVFPGAGDRVECGEIVGEGRKAVCGYADGSLRLFDLRGGEMLHSLIGGHKDGVNCVAGLQGRDMVLSGGRDGVVALWNAASGKQVTDLPCPLYFYSVLIIGGHAHLWGETGRELWPQCRRCGSAIGQDGKHCSDWHPGWHRGGVGPFLSDCAHQHEGGGGCHLPRNG